MASLFVVLRYKNKMWLIKKRSGLYSDNSQQSNTNVTLANERLMKNINQRDQYHQIITLSILTR